MDKHNRAARDMRHEISGGVLGNLVAIPFSFITGYLVGLLAPVAGLAAIVGGIYLLTRKVPFLSHSWPDDEGGQHLSLKLMPPDQAQAAFIQEKERISADLNTVSAEIKALAEPASRQKHAAHEAKSSVSEED
jgi:hypothetical protein